MSEAGPSPIKVAVETKEQVRIGAAVLGVSQAEFVGKAVCEYVQRHAGELHEGLQSARKALALGEDATLAHMTGASVEDVKRVTGR